MNAPRTRTHALSDEGNLDLHTIAGQIALSKKIRPFASILIKKISDCHDAQSMLTFGPDGGAVMFSHREGETLFFRYGARCILSFPESFMSSLDNETADQVDFLIKDWKFMVNDQEISTQLWCDNPYLDSGKILQGVPTSVEEILQAKKDKSLRGQWARLVNKMLPDRPQTGGESTERGIAKLRQTHTKKTSTIVMKKREENGN